jgi:energy-coupling factor transporter ATP-binding protein EcfA2
MTSRMPLLTLTLAAATSLGLAGVATYGLLRRTPRPARRGTDDPDSLSLTFHTTTAKAKQGWAAFWARDPFVQAQRERTGMAFGLYDVPGGEAIATHIAPADIQQHALVLGSTGSGKSSLLELLARYHLMEKRPFTLVDLHGDLFTRVAAWALHARVPRLVLLDFTRPELLPGWNPLTRVEGVDVGRHVDLLIGVLKRLYAGEDAASWAWGVKVEELMRYALRACIESEAVMSLVDLPQFFLIPAVRQRVLATASEQSRAYFTLRFGAREEMYVSAVLNKLEPFLGSIAVQRFLGQPRSTVDLLGAIDRGDTVVVNLAKGYLGPTADVVGRLLVNIFQMAALRRERMAPEKRRPYALLLDEAHVLAGAESGLEDFLVAARKYRVFVTLAAQGLSLFPPSFRPHLLGNTGRQFFFRLPYGEAKALSGDIFEPLGSVWREQTRPNEKIEEPLLTPAEEIAWRTRELANLPVGACYWLLKGRPYKARRVQVLKPLPAPYPARELHQRIDAAMAAHKDGNPVHAPEHALPHRLHAAVAERTARRNRAAGIREPYPDAA